MLTLTAAEKNFWANFWHETMALTRGPAMTWLKENGIEEREVWPFTTLFQMEYGLILGSPKPDTCEIPWSSVEDFHARAQELSIPMDQRLGKDLTAS